MRRSILVLGVIALFALPVWAEERPAAPAEPVFLAPPTGCEGADPAADICPASDLTLEAFKAAGFFQLDLRAPAGSDMDFPPCPDVYGCGGYNVTCRAVNCQTTDTGYSGCQLPGGAVVSCSGGKTIHVTNCGCQQVFEAYCCTHCPCCLCIGCNPGSQTVSCE